MKFILGTKGRMTQVFDESGRAYPATIISAGPLTVTQVKTADKDGYEAVQVGFGGRKEKNITKPLRGHLKDLGGFRWLREFRPRAGSLGELQRGDALDVSVFRAGDSVVVSAISKGKGFQGVVKRHGFAGGPRTHGNKHTERAPGSIGVGGVQRVMKGKRMAGRMGGDRVTVKNLRVLKVDADTNTLVVSGAVPGKPGTLVEIRSNAELTPNNAERTRKSSA
jgi:large subunit ribosomal protein L3